MCWLTTFTAFGENTKFEISNPKFCVCDLSLRNGFREVILWIIWYAPGLSNASQCGWISNRSFPLSSNMSRSDENCRYFKANAEIWDNHPPRECPVVENCTDLRTDSVVSSCGKKFAIKSRTNVQQEFICGVSLFFATPSKSASKSLLLSVPKLIPIWNYY